MHTSWFLVCQWLFFEQHIEEPYVAVRQTMYLYPEGSSQANPEWMQALLDVRNKAFMMLQVQLEKTRFLVEEEMSVANRI